MLELTGIGAAYGKHTALTGVDLFVDGSEIVVILGANGAGKSTLLKVIAGIVRPLPGGTVTLGGRQLTTIEPHRIVEAGIALVPEGRGIFADLTVHENLMLGAHPQRARAGEAKNLATVLELFPRLRERMRQHVHTMSGGEQQMVAIGRALMSRPKMILLDEPSMGLAPQLVEQIFEIVKQINEQEGVTILLAEQNTNIALRYAKFGYILESGRVVMEGEAEQLRNNEDVKEFYLGLGGEGRKSFRDVKHYRRRKRWIG